MFAAYGIVCAQLLVETCGSRLRVIPRASQVQRPHKTSVMTVPLRVASAVQPGQRERGSRKAIMRKPFDTSKRLTRLLHMLGAVVHSRNVVPGLTPLGVRTVRTSNSVATKHTGPATSLPIPKSEAFLFPLPTAAMALAEGWKAKRIDGESAFKMQTKRSARKNNMRATSFGCALVPCMAFAAWALGPAKSKRKFRNAEVACQAASVDSSASAVCFVGEPSGPGEYPPSPSDAPPRGSRSLDELKYLAGDPLRRRLAVTATAVTDLQASPSKVWEAISGGESYGLEKAWLELQPTGCYGIPRFLRLISVEGTLEAGNEIRGEVGVFGTTVRLFRWQVVEAKFEGLCGKLILNGQVDGEKGSFKHTIEISGNTGGGCTVQSEILYAPEAPLQTLLNAAGGRESQETGNAEMLRRLGILLDGDVDFDPVKFYDTTGKLIDILAPFEDSARDTLAKLSGLSSDGTSKFRVLEIGCGTGRWAQALLKQADDEQQLSPVDRYVGIDASLTMAVEAASALSKESRSRVVRADARQAGILRKLSESFLGGPPDRIVVSYVLDILDSCDIEIVLRQCAQLLRESGCTLGVTSIAPGSIIMEAWDFVWRRAPWMVGGCRPKNLRAQLERLGWNITAEERTNVLGYLSQVLIAKPPLDKRGGSTESSARPAVQCHPSGEVEHSHAWTPQDLTQDIPGCVPIPDDDYIKMYQRNPEELWPVELFIIVYRRRRGKTQVLVRPSSNGTSEWGLGTGVPLTRWVLQTQGSPPLGYRWSQPAITLAASNFPEFPKMDGLASWSYQKIDIREDAFNNPEFEDTKLEEYAQELQTALRAQVSQRMEERDTMNAWERSQLAVVQAALNKANSLAAIQGTLRMSGIFARKTKSTSGADDGPRYVSLDEGKAVLDPAMLVQSMRIFTMFPQMPDPMPLPSTTPEELQQEIRTRDSNMAKSGRDPHQDIHGRRFTHRSTSNVSNTIHGVYLTLDATDLFPGPDADDDVPPALDLFGTQYIQRYWKCLEDLKVLDNDSSDDGKKSISTADPKPTFISGFIIRQLVREAVISTSTGNDNN